MQSRGRLSFAGRLRAGFRTLSRFTPGLGGSDGQTARGIRSRGGELRRSSPFPRQSPQSARARKPGPQETTRLITVAQAARISQLPSANFSSSRGGTGRRVRLRTVWGNPWRFESSREHRCCPGLKVDRSVPSFRRWRTRSAGFLLSEKGSDENLRRYSLL